MKTNIKFHIPPFRLTHPYAKHILIFLLSICVLCILLVINIPSKSHAESIEVTATVPADPLLDPARITSPLDQEHLLTPTIPVRGTCPPASYVILYLNDVLSGAALCENERFTILVNLAPGSNKLQVRVYNLTNTEGPSSPPITVYYDIPLPLAPIIALSVTSVDSIPFGVGGFYKTTTQPTIRGFAPPYSFVTIVFGPITCMTKADSTGRWSCRPDQQLPPGNFTVDVSAITSQGAKLTIPQFRINTVEELSQVSPAPLAPLYATYNFSYQVKHPGELWKWVLVIKGGAQPYNLTIEWDDGSKTTINDAGEKPIIERAFKAERTYQPIVRVSDTTGTTLVLQLFALVVSRDEKDISIIPANSLGYWPYTVGIVAVSMILLTSITWTVHRWPHKPIDK